MAKIKEKFENVKLDQVFKAWEKLNNELTTLSTQFTTDQIEFVRRSIDVRKDVMKSIGGYVETTNPVTGKEVFVRL